MTRDGRASDTKADWQMATDSQAIDKKKFGR